ncbi:hypothetical protein [Ekhidna sp.]|uniref:hypothetical protein n=1 Tax=Ekhidna sp. TaxID=2608089 RepID=UPI0032EF2F4F
MKVTATFICIFISITASSQPINELFDGLWKGHLQSKYLLEESDSINQKGDLFVEIDADQISFRFSGDSLFMSYRDSVYGSYAINLPDSIGDNLSCYDGSGFTWLRVDEINKDTLILDPNMLSIGKKYKNMRSVGSRYILTRTQD